jgi:hypothetical protein
MRSCNGAAPHRVTTHREEPSSTESVFHTCTDHFVQLFFVRARAQSRTYSQEPLVTEPFSGRDLGGELARVSHLRPNLKVIEREAQVRYRKIFQLTRNCAEELCEPLPHKSTVFGTATTG